MEEIIGSPNGNFDKLKGMEFVAKDETRFTPDILQNGDAFFFPIFSTEKLWVSTEIIFLKYKNTY